MAKISLFDKASIKDLFDGLRWIDQGTKDHEFHDTRLSKLKPASIEDESSQCLTCNHFSSTREDQVEHYKSDWHRYNLKLKLTNATAVKEREFEDIMDEISSISGSETEDGSDAESDEEEKAKLDKALGKLTLSETENPLVKDSKPQKRTPKIYFVNADDVKISLYRCILPSTKDREDGVLDLDEVKSIISSPGKCCVILQSAGHFAAGVFEGPDAVVHKTFHRYVLRAKQGTVQSVRDKQGSAPKSGGASLRRHNEAALISDIQTLLNSWKEEFISKCSHIFLRAPHYNKRTFYNGKTAPLDKNDSRIRGVPFPTRRPTFNELKRVHKELFSAETRTKDQILVENESMATNSLDKTSEKISSEIEGQHEHCDNLKAKSMESMNIVDSQKSLSKKKRKKKESKNESVDALGQTQVCPLVEDIDETANDPIVDELFTVCKVGDLEGLNAVMSSLEREFSGNSSSENTETDVIALHLNQPINKENSTVLHIAAKSGQRAIVLRLLESGSDPGIKNKLGFVPYNLCSNKPMRNTFRKFMADNPGKFDYKIAQIPAPLTEEIENDRKSKANEKKKARNAAKKEKMREQKAVREKEEAERQEKERFAALSDREKRAIAAERRFAQQLSNQGNAPANSAKRCWLCGSSLLGKIPFEYFDYEFCSMTCLKKHKVLVNVSR